MRVLDKQEVPADMILLTSSETGGNCYIETSNIDGETNLKIKQAAQTNVDGTGPIWDGQGPEALFGWVHACIFHVYASGCWVSCFANRQPRLLIDRSPHCMQPTTTNDDKRWRSAVECELPNSRIHHFSGVIRHDSDNNREVRTNT